MKEMKGKDFMKIEEVALKLSISKSAVYNLIRRKRDPLPAYRLGGLRVNQAELTQWVTRQNVQEVAA